MEAGVGGSERSSRIIWGWSHSFFQSSPSTIAFASAGVISLYLGCELNLCSRLAGVMGLASVGASSIIASSMSVSFCGEIARDLTATLFLVMEPVGLFVGVWVVGTGFGMFGFFCCMEYFRASGGVDDVLVVSKCIRISVSVESSVVVLRGAD